MGGSSWSDSDYTLRSTTKKAAGKATFAYHAVATAAVATGKKATAHNKLDPKGVIRESRDSAAHPESVAVAVFFDVTGSMGSVPMVMQSKLPQLMGLLLRKNYLEHPQVMFAGIGDATCDQVPLQVGQFESGAEMDDDVTNLYLEGGGGGQTSESYQLAIYFAAHRTSIDCHEKRGKKGYLFLIGDEKAYTKCKRAELDEVLGVKVEADVLTVDAIKAAQEKFEVFFIIPNQTNYYGEAWLSKFWKELVGPERVLKLEDPEAVCELIGATIGACEGATIDRIAEDLADIGTSKAIVRAVTDTLDKAGVTSTAISTGTATGLPPATGPAASRI